MGSGCKSERYKIYVDGSCINGCVGYGIVILENEKIIAELSGTVPENLVQGTNQVAGELFAVKKAIEWCQRNNVKEISIFYDYEGIEKWVSGNWKAKNPVTQEYVDFISKSGIKIHWYKIHSHTGDPMNERVDRLARESCSSSESIDLLVSELECKALGFIEFLKSKGFNANLKGIYNSNCAKIEILEGNKSIGFLNIYHTKKIKFSPKYHELRENQDEIDSLWQEYNSGQISLLL
ncbi:MAG: RNase H family protein [bacterium]